MDGQRQGTKSEVRLRTFPGQSRHFTLHSCSPLGAIRGQISNRSSGYFAFIAACASISECGGKSCKEHIKGLAMKTVKTVPVGFYPPQLCAPAMSVDLRAQGLQTRHHRSWVAA